MVLMVLAQIPGIDAIVMMSETVGINIHNILTMILQWTSPTQYNILDVCTKFELYPSCCFKTIAWTHKSVTDRTE